jgi:hypothetical protein
VTLPILFGNFFARPVLAIHISAIQNLFPLKMHKQKTISAIKEKAKLLYKINSSTSQAYQLDCKTTTKRGLDVLKDPILNKGTAFSESERERLHLRGLLPPRVQTMEMQLERNSIYLSQALQNDEEAIQLQKYRDLGALQDRNEHLFYRVWPT